MLKSAREQYEEQQKITASAVLAARRRRQRGARGVADVITAHQLEAAALTFGSMVDVLAEQDIDAPPVAVASVSSIVTGRAAVPLIERAETNFALDRLVSSLVGDAGRTAAAVDMGRRPALTGYVRSLRPPTCSRCAILAGRVYRYSQGFPRHPLCDCLMTPTTQTIGPYLVTDPREAIENGWVRGLSKADTTALEAGADLNQVVNVRRTGLTVGSSVLARGSRLTPQGCLSLGSDRQDAIRLLTKHGYIRAS